jgi:hypothetical protein
MPGRFGRPAASATPGDILDRLGPSSQFGDPRLRQLLAGREQRKLHAQDPGAIGAREEARGLSQGLSGAQASRLGRARARGSRGFQNFSRNVDPLSGEHFLDFVDNANRLAAVRALLDPGRRGRPPGVGGLSGGFGGGF